MSREMWNGKVSTLVHFIHTIHSFNYKNKTFVYEDSSFEVKTFKTLFTKMPAQMSRAPLTLPRVLTNKKTASCQ